MVRKTKETKDDIEQKKLSLLQELKELTGEDVGLFIKRKQNSRVAFAQIIQHNLQILVENDYLTGAEESFILKISGYLEFKTNCLIEKESKNRKSNEVDLEAKSATPSYIANVIGCSRTTASLIMNSLRAKGILANADTGSVTNTGRVCTSRTWLMNPNIIICGEKHDIDPLLQRIFKNSALNNITTKDGKKIKLPVKLFL
ncbi:hypothetical protein bcgnr5379_59920 [Bacillus cereus]